MKRRQLKSAANSNLWKCPVLAEKKLRVEQIDVTPRAFVSLQLQVTLLTRQLAQLQEECAGFAVSLHAEFADFNPEDMRAHFTDLLQNLGQRLRARGQERQGILAQQRETLENNHKDGMRDAKQSLRSQANHYGIKTQLHWRRHQALVGRDG